MKKSLIALLAVLVVWGLPRLSQAGRDPRMVPVAQWLESGDLASLMGAFSCSDWTKSVLQALSGKERKQLAKSLLKAKNPAIREGRLEQYRVLWRSRDLPDSQAVVSFYMNARPNDLTKPLFAFSSEVKNIPRLLAETLDENRLPLVESFHEPLSPWLDVLSKITPDQRKNLTQFYRTLKLQDQQEADWVYKGPYLAANGILVQSTLHLRLNIEGRWLVE